MFTFKRESFGKQATILLHSQEEVQTRGIIKLGRPAQLRASTVESVGSKHLQPLKVMYIWPRTVRDRHVSQDC